MALAASQINFLIYQPFMLDIILINRYVIHFLYLLIREAAKKVLFLVAWPLRPLAPPP